MRAMVLSAYFPVSPFVVMCRTCFPDATRWFGRNATDKAE
jgi:hypothetical protein